MSISTRAKAHQDDAKSLNIITLSIRVYKYVKSSQLKSRSNCYVCDTFLPRSCKEWKKKGLVKDSSAARKVLVQTIITYVNNACVSFLAGGKMLLMTSSQTLSVRTIMPNSQFSNCIVNFKRFIEFSFRIFGKLRWPDL